MSPRTKEQNEEIRRQRMQQIMQAAILVYAEKGYAASEIGEVAERAGLARGLVYHYFKSKQALFQELYETMMERTQQRAILHFSQERNALELFGEYAQLVCRQMLDEPEVSRFYNRIPLDVHYLYLSEERSPFQWMTEYIKPMAAAIEKGISRGEIRSGDTSLLARQFWGAVSEGMNYLEQLRQDDRSKGIPEQETKEQLAKAVGQIVESAISVVRK
ncbi:TetR/AcrR family transcriptional regulator [Paenibacillus turpanensis]|uniref:TetR/AcrR family transcriptional regulator n=1 Tax=Paenibacillus turpanensis TaxID=2689078 RepID=UPI001A9CE094|nr:TetR/AcrR family transcriptional regulator [Paenibacillus turpanensis]